MPGLFFMWSIRLIYTDFKRADERLEPLTSPLCLT
jgi:hypothetical protein